MIGLVQRLRRFFVPGCGPVRIPVGAPVNVSVAGIPSCVGRCRKCVGTAASDGEPWYWWRDGELRSAIPPIGGGYLGGRIMA